jgi:hypothetical protein
MSAACRIKVSGRPCESRPWSKDRDARDIPEFSLEMAENLAATCPDERGMGPDFVAKWFARHLSREGSELPCASWLAMVGDAHPSVRMALRDGRLSPEAIRPASDGPVLHESYREVLEKLRRTVAQSVMYPRKRIVGDAGGLHIARKRIIDLDEPFTHEILLDLL